MDQVIKGNYSHDVTLAGTVGQVGQGLTGVDIVADARDLVYDFTHWEWSGAHAGQTLLDAVGLIPVIGVLKNVDEVATLVKNSDILGDTKHIDEVANKKLKVKYPTKIDSQVTEIEKAKLPDWMIRTFTEGEYRTVVTNENVTLYRTFGGRSDAGGAFATTMSAKNRIQAKIDTALLPEWGGTRMYEARIEVPRGQVLNIGQVAEQYTRTGTKLDGGADQILLPEKWSLEWIKDIKIIPSK